MRHSRVYIGVILSLVMCAADDTDDEGVADWLLKLNSSLTTQLNLDPQNFDFSPTTELNLDPVNFNSSPTTELNLDPVNLDIAGTTRTETDSTDQPTKCLMDNGQTGFCVAYYLCDTKTKTVIEDGYTLIDTRSGSSCPNFLQVCCLLANLVDDATYKTKKEKEAEGNQPTNFGSVLTTDIKKSEHQCGWSNPGLNIFHTREGAIGVTDGNKIYADAGDFPWMVAILKKNVNSEKWDKTNYLGGGSLIHRSVVMTVAHKFDKTKAQEIKCRAGEWDSATDEEEHPFQERNVAKVLIHPDFFRPSVLYDVALLFMEEPFILANAPHIGIGCLGRTLPTEGTACFSMGWGAEDFARKRQYSNVLKKVKLPLVGSETCAKLLRRTRLGPRFQLHESLTCAGGQKGIDTCRGDGGSPLVCQIGASSPRFAIYGMVAYGVGKCGEEDVPAVYVNVPHVYEWVVSQFEVEQYDAKSFTFDQ